MGFHPEHMGMASSVVDIVIVSALALTGTLMAPLPLQLLLALLVATLAFALILDLIKLPTIRFFKVQ